MKSQCVCMAWQEEQNKKNPDFSKIHHTTADTPEECIHLLLIKDVMHEDGYLVYECSECEQKKRPKRALKGRQTGWN